MRHGVVQIDSLRLDEAATDRAARRSSTPSSPRARAGSARPARARRAGSSSPMRRRSRCAAAQRRRHPVGRRSELHLGLDLRGLPRALAAAPELLPTIRGAYAHAATAWRLPMHGGFDDRSHRRSTCRSSRGMPRARRATCGGRCGCRPDRPLVLSSFGGYGVRDCDLTRLDCLDDMGHRDRDGGQASSTALTDGVHAVVTKTRCTTSGCATRTSSPPSTSS